MPRTSAFMLASVSPELADDGRAIAAVTVRLGQAMRHAGEPAHGLVILAVRDAWLRAATDSILENLKTSSAPDSTVRMTPEPAIELAAGTLDRPPPATPTVTAAIEALDSRKRALGLDDGQHARMFLDQETVDEGGVDGRALLVGLDVDPDELAKNAGIIGQNAIDGLAQVGPGPALGGLWVDGLLTGLLLAELRNQQEASDGA